MVYTFGEPISTPADTSRTVVVTVKTAFHSVAPRNVRFAGSKFRELRQRLVDANVPGIAANSFVEVLVEERYLCLLDDEKLPEGDLTVNVYNFSEGLQWSKAMPFAFAAPSAMQLPYDTSSPGYEHLGRGPGHPHHGPPHCHPRHGPPPHGPHQLEGPLPHGHGPDRFHGPHHDEHGKGKRGDKACGRHRRHHHSRERGRSHSPHRHGRHGHRHHASRSRSRSGSSSRSPSPPKRGGVNVHIHHHGPRFHGRGGHHHHHHDRMHPHGPGVCRHGASGQEDNVPAVEAQEPEEAGDWQEVSESGAAAKALEKLAV